MRSARSVPARAGGEADQIVHDDVNRATDGIGLQVREIHRFRKTPWPAKAASPCITMGTTLFSVSGERPRKGRASRSAFAWRGRGHGYGIDGFEMAGIRNEMDADFLAGAGDISARCAT